MRNKKNTTILDIMGAGAPKGMFVNKPAMNIHEFYLGGTIGPADDYIEWFDTIRNAGQNDIVKIYINSYGGDLFTAIQFMRVLDETQATVYVSVEGACMSAATIIFMGGHQVEVSSHSMFMFHNYSGGTIGKGGEMIDQLLHEREWSKNLMSSVYKDFLSDAEIESMMDNKDIWMDGEEVVTRLELKIQKEEKEKEESEEKELTSDEE